MPMPNPPKIRIAINCEAVATSAEPTLTASIMMSNFD
jgi:hypothetical protein